MKVAASVCETWSHFYQSEDGHIPGKNILHCGTTRESLFSFCTVNPFLRINWDDESLDMQNFRITGFFL